MSTAYAALGAAMAIALMTAAAGRASNRLNVQ
jgi:hypothetical protein